MDAKTTVARTRAQTKQTKPTIETMAVHHKPTTSHFIAEDFATSSTATVVVCSGDEPAGLLFNESGPTSVLDPGPETKPGYLTFLSQLKVVVQDGSTADPPVAVAVGVEQIAVGT